MNQHANLYLFGIPGRQKCLVKLRPNGTPLRAYLIGTAPCELEMDEWPDGSPSPLRKMTVQALVALEEFDCGGVYQVSFARVQLVDEWEESNDQTL
jgi:hypothetical protein